MHGVQVPLVGENLRGEVQVRQLVSRIPLQVVHDRWQSWQVRTGPTRPANCPWFEHGTQVLVVVFKAKVVLQERQVRRLEERQLAQLEPHREQVDPV